MATNTTSPQVMTSRGRLSRFLGHLTALRRLPQYLSRDIGYVARIASHTIALAILIALANIYLLGALVVKPFSPKIGWGISCWTAYVLTLACPESSVEQCFEPR